MYLKKTTIEWLLQCGVIPAIPSHQTQLGYLLSQDHQASIQNGTAVAQLISHKYSGMRAIVQPMSSIKHSNSQSAKVYNWNLIWTALKQAKMQFQEQFKSLVVAGDLQLLQQLLFKLEDKNPLQASVGPYTKDKKDQQRRRKALQPFDASKLDSKKGLQQTNNTLQFLILGLSKELNLPVKQVIGLFSNQNKYLAHLLAKGFKGQFTHLISFYKNVSKNVNHLVTLFSYDQTHKSILLTLQALKPAFVSKSHELVQQCCKLFVEISNKIQTQGIDPEVKKWFMLEQSRGLLTVILGVHRHPSLGQLFSAVILKYCENNFQKVFQNQISQLVENKNQFYTVMNSLLVPSVQFQQIRKAISSATILTWVTQARASLSNTAQQAKSQRSLAFRFLCQLWLAFPRIFQEQDDQLKSSLSSEWSIKSICEFLNSVASLFQQLNRFASNKDPAALQAYQIICQVFRQCIKDQDKRTYILLNLIPTYQKYPQMPIEQAIRPLSSAIHDGIHLQNTDIRFMHEVSKLTKLRVQLAIELSQSLVKNFVDNVVFAGQMQPVIVLLLGRFMNEIQAIEHTVRLSKHLLAFIFTGDKAKKPRQHSLPSYNGRKPSQKKLPIHQLQSQIILSQKRARMVQLIKRYLQLGNQQLNIRLKPLISQTNYQLKLFHKNQKGHKGLYMLMSMLGNPKQLMQEAQAKDRQSKLKQLGYEPSQAQSKAIPRQSIFSTYQRNQQSILLIKQTKDHKLAIKRQEQRLRQQAIQKKKEKVAKDLITRQIILGAGRTKDNEINLLREYGQWQKQLNSIQKEPQAVEQQLLQDRDIQYIQVLLKKYQKGFRSIFNKYANSGYNPNTRSSNAQSVFQHIMERTQYMNQAQCNKFIKDYGIINYIKKQQNQTLLRNFTVKILKRRDNTDLDFYAFQKYLVQLAIYTTNCPQRNCVGLSQGQQMQIFIKGIRDNMAVRKEKTYLFDSPDTAFFNQSDLLQQFNRRLTQDQQFVLPQGYRKVMQKQVHMDYKLGAALQQNYIYCFQILDQLINDQLNIKLIQPRISKSTIVKAKPSALPKPTSKIMLQKNSTRPQRKNYEKTDSMDRKRRIVDAHQKVNLTLGMKLGISYLGPKQKKLGQQVAYVLEQVLRAVQLGKQMPLSKIENEIQKKKRMQQQQIKRKQMQRIVKLKERKEQLLKQKKHIQNKKMQQQEQTKQQRQKQQQQKQKKQHIRKQKQQKYIKNLKTKVQNKKAKQQQQKKQRKIEQDAKKKKDFTQRKKKFQQFNSKRVKQYDSKYQQQKRQAQIKNRANQQKRQKQQQLRKKIKGKIQKVSQKTKELQRQINQKIFDLHTSQQVQHFYKNKFKDSLQNLWQLTRRLAFLSITGQKQQLIGRQQFKDFGRVFKISPPIIHPKQLMYIFNSLTKKKKGQIGLDRGQFEQALTRLAIKGKSVFNEFSKIITIRQMQEHQAGQIIKKEGQKNQFQEQKQQPQQQKGDKILDNYGDLSKANSGTVKGLLYYLRIPDDKAKADQYFKQLLQSANSTISKKDIKQKFKQNMANLIQMKKNPNSNKKNQPHYNLQQSTKLKNESKHEQQQGEGEAQQ